MKVFTVVALLLAVAASYPTVKTWTLDELSEVIEKEEGSPEMRKYYEEALNRIMCAEITDDTYYFAFILSPRGKMKWTLQELKTALRDPTLSKYLRPFFELSYNRILSNEAGSTALLNVPAVDISTWTTSDVNKYIRDPKTNPDLLPFLKKAQKEIEKTKGKKKVTLVTPVDLVPVKKRTINWVHGPKNKNETIDCSIEIYK